MKKNRPAVLLQNLGSPSSTSVSDVRSYLREFLMDERVIDLPTPLRWALVHLFILPIRPARSAAAYREIWTEEGSPLIVTSRKQQERLAEQLQIPVYLSMRYGQPSTAEVIQQIRADRITDLFVIPLYPHYSMASYETAVVQLQEQLLQQPGVPRVTLQPPFYNDPDYIKALAAMVREHLPTPPDHFLMSYHGIPERHLRKSDPSHAHCLRSAECCDQTHPAHATCYRHQCLETSRLLVAELGYPANKVSVSFQSRLGREPWLQPYTDKTLEALGKRKIKHLAVICPAFISDCLETLEEIQGEGSEIFREAGGETFTMVPCLNDHPLWIQWMARRAQAWLDTPYGPSLSQLPKFYYPRD